jgi:hypothetical protein
MEYKPQLRGEKSKRQRRREERWAEHHTDPAELRASAAEKVRRLHSNSPTAQRP